MRITLMAIKDGQYGGGSDIAVAGGMGTGQLEGATGPPGWKRPLTCRKSNFIWLPQPRQEATALLRYFRFFQSHRVNRQVLHAPG